jgi:4-amino-4-deoxychorismate lyase
VSYGILVNGQTKDTIAVQDRGLQYGDGLFETMAVIQGQPRHWTRHYQRLAEGCERLKLPLPDEALLLDEMAKLHGSLDCGVLKLILTRGSGGRGYRVPEAVTPLRILATYPWPDYPESYCREGVAVRICTTRLGRNPLLAGLKHLNRMEQVMARSEWNDQAIAEGLMQDTEGAVISGAMSNLFLVRDGTLITADLTQCGIRGIMRGVILDLACQMNIPTSIRPVSLDEVYAADEAFLCNSLIGIWPISRLVGEKDKTFKPGDLTCRLMEAIKEPLI